MSTTHCKPHEVVPEVLRTYLTGTMQQPRRSCASSTSDRELIR
jgi:hypothetical protein